MTWLLTHRQRRVLQLAAGGAGVLEIALILEIGAPTVSNHFTSIHRRLGVSSRTQAVLAGIWLGEVDELQAYADLEGRRRCAVN